MTEKEKSPEEGGLISDVNSHKDSDNKGVTKELLEEIISLPDKPEGKEDIEKFQNKFPVHAFPKWTRELIQDCETSLNFPTDYTGSAILSAISTAIGKSAKVKVKNGWYEYPSLYVAIVGNPGANKSHPLEKAFKVHIDRDKDIINEYKAEYEAYEEYLLLSKKDKSVNNDKNDIGQREKPILRKTVLHNFTPEILYQRLVDNIRGCIVVSEELATFFELMNNYSKGDNSGIYLSFWNNKGTSIDRVGKPIPLFIQEPFLNIMGGLQPKILPKIFPSNKSDNGFLQRFLFAFPDNTEKQPINDNELNNQLLTNYSNWINTYISKTPIRFDNEGNPEPKIYYWSSEAKDYFYSWHKDNTQLVNNYPETLKGSVLSKFDMHFIRLSLIFQIMEDYTTNEIGLNAVASAKCIIDYYIECSFRVIDILENNRGDELPDNKAAFYKALPNEFTTAEAKEKGLEFSFNERAVHRFISETSYFKKLSYGRYAKK